MSRSVSFPRFFKRELDYEDRAAVEALLKEVGTKLGAKVAD